MKDFLIAVSILTACYIFVLLFAVALIRPTEYACTHDVKKRVEILFPATKIACWLNEEVQ